MTTTREISFKAIVESVDVDNRKYESDHPIVYRFSKGNTKRDTGPDGGAYKQP